MKFPRFFQTPSSQVNRIFDMLWIDDIYDEITIATYAGAFRCSRSTAHRHLTWLHENGWLSKHWEKYRPHVERTYYKPTDTMIGHLDHLRELEDRFMPSV